MSHQLYLQSAGQIQILPVLHYRMEFAFLVREAVRSVNPDCIAIELPSTLGDAFLRGVSRLPEISIISYDLEAEPDGGTMTAYLPVEGTDPFAEAARLAASLAIPVHFIDVDVGGYPLHDDPLPDGYAVYRLGLAPYFHECDNAFSRMEPESTDLRRERGMAFRLQQLAKKYRSILFICGMYHTKRVRQFLEEPQAEPMGRVRRAGVMLSNLHPDSCREVLAEPPYIAGIYEHRRNDLLPDPPAAEGTMRRRYRAFEIITGAREVPEEEVLKTALARCARLSGKEQEMPDRQRAILALFREAARHYRQETGEPVHLWQKRAFFRFSRNYALLSGRLLPDLFQMLVSARGCVDDNFAYSFWRLATFFPWQRESADIPTIRLSPEELWGGCRHIRFRPRKPGRGKGLSPLKFLQRKKELHPGEWLEGFDNPSICSYPPEDIVIEDYGRFLKKKGAKQLSAEQCRVEPFSTSLLDGIDMRETLRNVHQGRIYVREEQRVKGGVGGVVIIFDEDRRGVRFPYRMTWLGEHDQESDMAFYATSPAENVVGPGICRCEYGGLLLSFPPRRMYDIWTDPDYRGGWKKHEVLLLAALEYSREKHVVYAAPRPPRSFFKQVAARFGKKIVYIPLGSLSPGRVKRLRVFHILHGHDKRAIAKDYVW